MLSLVVMPIIVVMFGWLSVTVKSADKPNFIDVSNVAGQIR